MTKKIRKNYNTLKWVTGILFFIIAFLLIMSWSLSVKFKPLIKDHVKELVLNATDSLYRIEFTEVSTNFITAGATLTDVKITPDTNIYNKLVALKKAPNNIYTIQLKKLSIKNFHPLRLLRSKRLKIELLLFDNPDVVMVNRQFTYNENTRKFPEQSSYSYISKYLKELRIRTIDFKNMRFKYVNNNLGKPEMDSVKNLNITLKDWLIDAHSTADSSRLYLLKDVVINLNDYTFATPDSLYHINLHQLNFKASSGKLNVKSFSVVPRFDEMKFGQTVGYAKDRFNINMDDISMEGIDLPLYVRKRELSAKEMNISNGFVEVFNDNSLKRPMAVKIDKFPHQLLQSVNRQLTVKQLNLSNVDISYAEFDRDSRQKGKITFEKTSGTITNVTNAPKVKIKNPYMFANLTAYMMGVGKLDVNFRFNLMAKDGAFSYSGVLGQLDGRTLNRITKPLGMIEVKSGHVKKMEFNIDANDDVATGKVDFAFNNLSVALLKKDKDQDRLVKQGLMSFLANAMIINSDNPNAKGILMTVPIRYEHVKTSSFFNYIWRTLFQGIKYSVGITPQKEKKIREQIAKFDQIKIDRDKRRVEREKRRIRRASR